MKKIACLTLLILSITYALVSCQKKMTPFFTLKAANKYEQIKKISEQTSAIDPKSEIVDPSLSVTATSDHKVVQNTQKPASQKSIKSQIDYSKLSPKQSKRLEKLERKLAKTSGDDQGVALVLAIFLGCFGIHRFYLGYIWQGVVQLLTAGCCGVWALIDIIRIATGDLQPYEGSYSNTI